MSDLEAIRAHIETISGMMAVQYQSIDHRLELLGSKIDMVARNVITEDDCRDCKSQQSKDHAQLDKELSSKIDKKPFLIAGGSVVLLIVALTALNLWLSVNAGVVKAVMSP